MRSDKYLWNKVCMPIYRELYQKSTPKADIDKLIEDGTTKKENWFYQYYLNDKQLKEILEKHCKKHKLTKWEKRKVNFEIMLGASPCSSKKRWKSETGKNKVKNQRRCIC